VRVSLVLAGFILLAGCLGSNGPAATPAPGSPSFGALTGDSPPGCDASRPALVHGPNGAPVAWDGPVGIPCLVTTVWGTGEPSMGLTSDGTLFLYPSEQAPNEALTPAEQFTGLAMARSQDSGKTFTRQFSEVAGEANWHPYTADPFMYVDPYTDRVFMEDLAAPPFNCSNLSYSDDGGDTWTQSVGGCLVWDHVGYGSGPSTLGDLDGYPAVLQRCAITYVMTTVISEASGCQKSLDGGATWQPPGDPAFLFGSNGQPYVPSTCNGAVHHVFVDHRGWTWLGRGWCGSDGRNDPYVALSKDEGATWTRFRIDDEAAAGHDVGVGVDPNGTVYAFWTRASDRLPVLAVSHDDGTTWSEPIVVAAPGVTSAGSISIAPGGVGKAALFYAATVKSDGGKTVQGVAAAAYGLDGPSPVFQSAFVSTTDEPLQAGNCADGFCDGQADFLDASVSPDGTAWGSFVKEDKLSAGRIWGAPSLWDADDPNGVYGGWTSLVS
jgi:hypothetical protein